MTEPECSLELTRPTRPGDLPAPAPAGLAHLLAFAEAEGDACEAAVEAAVGAAREQGGGDILPRLGDPRTRRALAGDFTELGAWLERRARLVADQGGSRAPLHAQLDTWTRVTAGRLAAALAADPGALPEALDALLWFAAGMRRAAIDAHTRAEAERLQRERAALAAEKETLESILDSMREGVVVATASGEYRRVNDAARFLTGADDAGAAEWPRVSHVYLPDGETLFPIEALPLSRALAGERTDDVEMVVGPPEGPRRVLAVSGRPLRAGDAEVPWGGLITFRDVTEARRHAALRERAVELEQQNLRIAEANRLKSEFLASMSHELRTPLNAIIGFAELMHDERVGDVSETHREFLGDILASGHHLLALINDVLDLAKVEAGRLELRPAAVSLGQVCREVGAILRTSATDKRLRVAYDLAPDVDEVFLDPGRLKQVLYNYLANAIAFTGEGGRVVVRTRPEGPAAFRLEVEDTGVGIYPDDQGRLFSEFQQLGGGPERPGGGTGLGLALTKRLVEAQGGCVGLHSTPGVGSTFHAVLPRRAAHGQPLPNRRRIDGPTPTAPVVLVVEDDADEQEAIVRTLVGAGFAVETVSTCAQALVQCEGQRYDAITLDLVLPDASGLEVLGALGRPGPNQNTPVIVISVADGGSLVGGFRVHDILAKPLDPGALLGSLARAAAPAPGGGPILVVDDDAHSLRLMEVALSQLGYETLAASSGDEALELAAVRAPSAVILDLLMPEMDGFEFLDRFRAAPDRARVPVIIWTVADLTSRDLDRLRAGAQAVLLKGRQVGGPGRGLLDELRAFLPPPSQPRRP